MTEPQEMAVDLEKVIDALAHTSLLLSGLDQADTARLGEIRPRQSALRTRVEHAVLTVERIADDLRAMAQRAANTPPPDGPPLSRDSGPI
jgi:hypothetical protein